MKDFELFGTCLTHDGKKTIMLNWIFFSHDNFSEEFIIEKSQNNQQFEIIGKETKIIHSQRLFQYLFIDDNIECRNNCYRIFLKRKGSSKKIISKSNIITINLVDNNYNIDNAEEIIEETAEEIIR